MTEWPGGSAVTVILQGHTQNKCDVKAQSVLDHRCIIVCNVYVCGC